MKLQCGREYGFADDSQLPRATQLDKLTEDEFFGLSTNNLSTERDFSIFNRLSEVVKFRNYRLQAESIKNDMTLYKSKTRLVQNITKQVKKSCKLERPNGMSNEDIDEGQDTSKVWKVEQPEGLLQKASGEL